MRVRITILLIWFLVEGGLSQSTIDKYVRANNAINQMNNNNMQQGDMIYQVRSSETTELVGDPYFDVHWAKSSILLYDGRLIEGQLIRYDIRQNEFEIRLNGIVKVLSGSLVQNVVWVDSLDSSNKYLVNTKNLNWENSKSTGFMELLVEGEIPLMKRITLEILKPDYNLALNVGSKDFRIIKRVKYYYVRNSTIYEIKRRDFIDKFKEKFPDIESFCKKQSISWSKQSDLVQLFNYLNLKQEN